MDKYERFEAWLRENGAQFALLEMKEYEDGAGDDQGHHEELDYEEEEEKKEPSGYNFGSGPEETVANHRHCSTTSATNSNHNNTSSAQRNITQQQQQTEEDQHESEMRGVHARTHLPANTVCMSIPRKCLITVEMGQATPIGQLIAASDLDLDAPKHIYLMIYILWDRKVHGAHSFFHPYYEILPKTLSNMPIFWSDAEKAYLQGSYLLEQIQDRDLAITEDYQAICSIAPKLQDICTLDEFKWARMCVCSRNFGLSMDGHRTSALVPYADMLNHYRPRETKWTFDEDRQAFTITTLQQIPAGAQVYDSYGQKCNHRFLLNYGFAVEDNRELDGFCPNEVPIELSIAPNDPIYRLKLEFWLRGEPGNSFAHQHPQLHHSSSMPSHSALAAAVASVAATSANQQSSTRAPTTTAMTTASRDALVTVVEAAVNYRNRQAVAQQQQQQQQQYPYDLASAANLQSSAGLSKRVRVCVSNNENTRLLFSLLRAAVCNEDELVAITTPVTTISGSDVIMSSAGLFGMGRPLPPQVPPLAPSFLETVTSPSSQSTRMYYRSCRDIRHPISIRNERGAMQLLLDTVGRQLSQYPTSLVQDVSDLMDERAFPRFSNQRHAKIQVRGEKEVLHHFGQWARTALNVLQVIENELVQERQAISAAAYASGAGSSSASRSTPDTAARGNSNFWSLSGGTASTSTTLRRTATNTTGGSAASANNRVAVDSHFDYIIQSMEEEETGLHHTIVRYCADVLGSLRREEFKNLRRQRALWTNHSGGDNHNNNNYQGYA